MGLKSITIYGKKPTEVIDIVHQMKAHGWVDKVDFDWAYYHKAELSESGERERYATFNFYKEEYSTYFALRWL